MIDNEDELIANLLYSCWSPVVNSGEEPTIFSLQDTIDLIIKKYGEDWRKYPHCKIVIIWNSRIFSSDHVKQIVPDLFELSEEYRNKGTVNGKEMPENIFLLAFAVVSPNYGIDELENT